MTDAVWGLWLQPACQAGLDGPCYIIREKNNNDDVGVFFFFVSQLNNYVLQIDESSAAADAAASACFYGTVLFRDNAANRGNMLLPSY